MLAAFAVAEPLWAAPQAAAPKVEIVGSTFQVTLTDGSVLAPRDLPGVILALGDGSGTQRRLRIDAVEPDPKDHSGEILLYTLSEVDAATGEWRNACQPDPDGKRFGFPLAGHFAADGRYVPQAGQLLITCTGGAEGKCVRFGYHPWESRSDGTSLLSAYNACVRLVRADYAGDGRGTTRNGQPIDIYDAFGIETPAYDPAYEFEAGFTAEGAVCVRHVRVPENITLSALEAQAPRLAGKIGPICTEDYARAAGAILFVRSPVNNTKP
jgi:ADYC domain-containing protein